MMNEILNSLIAGRLAAFRIFVAAVILSLLLPVSPLKAQSGKVIIGYVGGFRGLIKTNLIQAIKLTHINYAFVDIKNNRAWLHREATDTLNFRHLNLLKKDNPNLKILISIGGWTWSGKFSDAVLTDTARQRFVASAVNIIQKFDLDGIDIDWEYPGQAGYDGNIYRPEDKENYTLLFKELRRQTDSLGWRTGKKYLLTTAVGAFKGYLDHADMAYEWMYGTTPTRSGLVDQELSKELQDLYIEYQKSLNLQGKNGFGILTAENYGDYLLQNYLFPSANVYLKSLTDGVRQEYLERNKWIKWTENKATFTFSGYVRHVGRMKGLPAFDDFNMKQPEPILFGTKTTNANHFTVFSLRQTTENNHAVLGIDLKKSINLMNAMYFAGLKNKGCAGYWWIRNGTSDNHTSETVAINLATSLENQNKKVNAWLFWDGGHCADDDPEGFISWMGSITEN